MSPTSAHPREARREVVGSRALILLALAVYLSSLGLILAHTLWFHEPAQATKEASSSDTRIPEGDPNLGVIDRTDKEGENQERKDKKSYTYTFDGSPASSRSFNPPDWDVVVHSRDHETWTQLEPMDAQHGPHCDAPPATHHHTGDYAQAVFTCRDHVMTALNATGYGLIYLTPNQLVDFSHGEAVIRFDLSTLRTSPRDWVDLWITPFEHNLQLPFDDGDVDLQGAPRHAVHIVMDNASGDGTNFKPEVYHDFQRTDDFRPLSDDYNWYTGYESFLTPSAQRRDLVEVRLSRTHLKVGMPAYNFWWVDKAIAPLPWTRGIVQFGHHSYNPTKDCPADSPCTPNTWHWDNVSISPAVPFTIIKADRRFVTRADAGRAPETIRFTQGAPANAYLRFAAVGTVEVSFDGGKTWQAARKQPSSLLGSGDYHPEHMSNYWMPVPVGTRTLDLRFSPDDWYTELFVAKDFAFWSAP